MSVVSNNILHAPANLTALNSIAYGQFSNNNAVILRVDGSLVGTIKVYGSSDGGTTFDTAPLRVIDYLSNAATKISITSNGIYIIPLVQRLPAQGIGGGAYDVFKLQVTAYTSGTAVVQGSSFHACITVNQDKPFEPDVALGTTLTTATESGTLVTLTSEKPAMRFVNVGNQNIFAKFGPTAGVAATPTVFTICFIPNVVENFTIPFGCSYMHLITDTGSGNQVLQSLPGEGS